jgi:phage terminase small subunit
MAAPKKRTLSRKKKKFLAEYVKDMNGAQAAMRAGYSPDNPKAAAVAACKILKEPLAEAWLKEKWDAAEFDMSLIFAETYKIALAEADGKVVKSADKVAAQDKLYRLAGRYNDKTEITGNGIIPTVNITLKKDE